MCPDVAQSEVFDDVEITLVTDFLTSSIYPPRARGKHEECKDKEQK